VALVNLPTAALQFARDQDLRFDAVITAYSLLDRRPANEMTTWCQEHKVLLIVYSSIGGGFLSDRYLGLPEPTRDALTTESLRRFALTVRIWGGWSLLQVSYFSRID